MLECHYHCPQSDEERMLQGTWCTPEIHKAIEKGYRLVRIHEVWDFPQRRKGLFQPYVDTWWKVKQESGGYPNWLRTDTQKEEYIHRYEEKEGIRLDPTKIVKNPRRKATTKLMLKSEFFLSPRGRWHMIGKITILIFRSEIP